jgi:hypothetical protein
MAAERKGKKLRRCTARAAAYYKVQFGKTENNHKKRLSLHIRNHPRDTQAISRFEKDMGNAKGLLTTLTRKAQKRESRTYIVRLHSE